MPHIFVVDDSISVRKALEIAFRGANITSRSAASAEEALATLDDAPFDLVIADVVMPGRSGFELCQELKANPRYAEVPVLMISGNVNDDVERQAQEVGAAGVLRKPFRADELLPVVQSALSSAARRLPQAPLSESLFERLIAQPGMLSVVRYAPGGAVLEQRGELPSAMAHYVQFYLSTAGVLGQQLGEGAASSVQLSYTHHLLSITAGAKDVVVSWERLSDGPRTAGMRALEA